MKKRKSVKTEEAKKILANDIIYLQELYGRDPTVEALRFYCSIIQHLPPENKYNK